MSKLKNIIKQLSDKDYQAIFTSLMDSNAEKSASLLKFLKEKQLSDNKIMTELDVNPNAYYTLRSRLNEKIEEYLVKEMESPKTDILKKVANINEIVYTKKRTIVIATLKKLEKELIDYDLSNELIIVYKNLKKLHINTAEHYFYSQLYNKHVAYTLAMDKAEDILADYFKKYGSYFLGAEDIIKTELSLLHKELGNISRLYQSHRLFVYHSCLSIFHRIHVEPEYKLTEFDDTLEVAFEKIDKIFETYVSDAHYHHLRIVFDFLKLEFYNSTKQPRKEEKHYSDVNDFVGLFLSNYGLFTFPSLFLIAKLQRHMKQIELTDAIEENKVIFADFECDAIDVPKYITYHCYRALCFYYAEKYDQAAKIINNILNEVSLKKYPEVLVEIKAFLALQYCLLNDDDLFNQLMNSVQRQIRMIGKKQLDHIVLLTKAMKVSLSGSGRAKEGKIKALLSKASVDKMKSFSPLKYIALDQRLIDKLGM